MDIYEIRNELAKGKTIYDLPLRVTFYARVSTSTSEQLSSLKAQYDYYRELINSKPNWIFVEGYIDSGYTGTSTTKREEFNNMVGDARERKFDLLLTKAISRFARNTLDSIFYTRELLKCGVGVYFESENINTLDKDAELRLSIMASLAQDESRQTSSRVIWGHKRKRERGSIYSNNKMLGYVNDESRNKLLIVESEAVIIKKIFDYYCRGFGFRKISQMLYDEGFKNSKDKPIVPTNLQYIVSNPRYKGYFTAKLTETTDFMTKERKIFGKDEIISYKDHDTVPPIISEEQWEEANKILKSRSEKMSSVDKTSYQNKFTYSGKIICKEHGTTYWHGEYKYKNGITKETWQCSEYRKKGKNYCNSPTLYTDELDEMMKKILQEIHKNKNEYINEAIKMYEEILNETNYDKDIKSIMKMEQDFKIKKEKLLELVINGFIENDEFKKRNDLFNDEISKLELQREKYEELNDGKNNIISKVNVVKKMFNEKFITDNITNENINSLLNRIEVHPFHNTENIKMNIYLNILSDYEVNMFKNIPINKTVNSNVSLLLIRHSDDDKLTLRFPRTINGDKGLNSLYNLTIETDVYMDIIA